MFLSMYKEERWNQENKSSRKIRKFFRINTNGLTGDVGHTKEYSKTGMISNGHEGEGSIQAFTDHEQLSKFELPDIKLKF